MDKSKYLAKAKDSFKTKKNLFLFYQAINGNTSFTVADFKAFHINDELINKYSGEYWQEYEEHRINGVSIKEIYLSIQLLEKVNTELLKQLQADYIESFNSVFPEIEFTELLEKESCHYCNITKEEIESLGINKKLFKKSFRGWNLEIDRLNSNLEYTKKNCVMACYWCNNAKTDEFTEDEFIKIGAGIGKVWKARLRECI